VLNRVLAGRTRPGVSQLWGQYGRAHLAAQTPSSLQGHNIDDPGRTVVVTQDGAMDPFPRAVPWGLILGPGLLPRFPPSLVAACLPRSPGKE
jgi:hypothetical protein